LKGKNQIVTLGIDWRPDRDEGYRLRVATVIPISDRRARLAFFLALLDALGPQRLWIGIGWALALATAAAICTAFTLRIHPERWGALLVARAGLIGAMAGGTALFVRLMAVID
jgi:hypothetical protein